MLYELMIHLAQAPDTRDLSPQAVDALLEIMSFAGEHVAWSETLGDARRLHDQADRFGPAWSDVDRLKAALGKHLETHGGFLDLEEYDEGDDDAEESGAAVIARLAGALPPAAGRARSELKTTLRTRYLPPSPPPRIGNTQNCEKHPKIPGYPESVSY